MNRIRKASPKILIVCLGAPKQERWLDANKTTLHSIGIRVAMSAGGSIDFVAGTAKRAPTYVSSVGLEWLYRLVKQPKVRLTRMISRLPLFLAKGTIEAFAHRIKT